MLPFGFSVHGHSNSAIEDSRLQRVVFDARLGDGPVVFVTNRRRLPAEGPIGRLFSDPLHHLNDVLSGTGTILRQFVIQHVRLVELRSNRDALLRDVLQLGIRTVFAQSPRDLAELVVIATVSRPIGRA